MDANKTPFHLLLGKHDWQPLIAKSDPGTQPNLIYDGDRNTVSLQPLLFRFRTSPNDAPPPLEARRGAARDQYGHWFWIDGGGFELRMLPVGERVSTHYWSALDWAKDSAPTSGGSFAPVTPAPPTKVELRGLVITERHYLVVGTIQPAGLLVFDMQAGGPPQWLLWPAGIPFAPYDMAPLPGGGVAILDRTNQRYWLLDCNLDVVNANQTLVPLEPPVPSEFQPEPVPRFRQEFPAGIVPGLAAPLPMANPIAIEGLPDGSVLILDQGADQSASTLYRLQMGELIGLPFDLQIPGDQLEGAAATALMLRGFDFAFLPYTGADPSIVTGVVYVTATDGNQTFAFSLYGDGSDTQFELELRYLPMRKFSGKGLVAAGDQVWYDYGDQWVPLTDQARPRYEPSGQLTTGTLDGKRPDCTWHRLFLDACIPGGTAITVESRAADDSDLLDGLPWQPEPAPYLRSGGAELPNYRPFAPDEAAMEGTGTWELLLQTARGRYLQLRLTLSGTGRNTPRLRALRVYYPRFSYLKEYLPDVYRQDEASASFLERFLANPEGLYTALEDRIAQAQTLFDIRTVPPAYLEWLAGWFGAMLDPAWDEVRMRLFIKHAPELFRERGTVPGVIRAIRLAIDPCPSDDLFTADVTTGGIHAVRIVEGFLTRRAPGVVFGDPTGGSGGPGVTTDLLQWRPDMGAGPIHDRYIKFVGDRYGWDAKAASQAWQRNVVFQALRFPPVMPVCAAPAELDTWKQFVQFGLGFTYAAVEPRDVLPYRQFLARRYRRIQELNQAYGVTLSNFDAVGLPAVLPNGGRPLYDWFQFASAYLPTVRISHRFTVLVPTRAYADVGGTPPNLDVVRRIVALEKPAHTDFAVKEYWAMFRVGEARLGVDTYLEQGARLPAFMLGSGHLAQGYLVTNYPWNVPDRKVVGRDRI